MTTTKGSKKPQYKLLTIKLDNGTSVNVSRASLEDTQTLIDIQDRLLQRYVEVDGAFAELFGDANFVADLTAACSFLPIVGKENEYLDYEDIKDNWEQIVNLFFNGEFNPETREHPRIGQSQVSQLHFLPFGKLLEKHLEAKRTEASLS